MEKPLWSLGSCLTTTVVPTYLRLWLAPWRQPRRGKWFPTTANCFSRVSTIMSRSPCSKNKGSLWARWAPVSFGLHGPSINWDVTQYCIITWPLFMLLIFSIFICIVFTHFSTFLWEISVSDTAVFNQSSDSVPKMHKSRNATMCNAFFTWICCLNFRFHRAVWDYITSNYQSDLENVSVKLQEEFLSPAFCGSGSRSAVIQLL